MTTSIASETPITVTAETTVREAAQKMRAHRVSCVVVVDGRRPIGIVTDRDLALRVLAEDLRTSTTVSEVMTPDPITAPESSGMETILRLLRRSGRRHLLLVDAAGGLVEMITHDDLVPVLQRELRNLGETIGCAVGAPELR